MLTTKEVRKIMRKHGAWFGVIYTNKVKDPNVRHVKCYYNANNRDDTEMFKQLQELAGAENVKVTKGAGYGYAPKGIVVKCKMS